MTTIFKPMLATDAVLEKLRFPLLASPKLDGVRAIVRNGVVYSRSNKPIPNKYVQQQFSKYEYFDGELIVGDANSPTAYRDTVSHVMSIDKTGFDLTFHVFDSVRDLADDYSTRHRWLTNWASCITNVVVHEQVETNNLEELTTYEEECLERGYEGLILRDPNAPYKNGRSTVNEGYLLKMKRFVDAEATVISFEERMRNDNEKTVNELGRSKRSSHQAGRFGRGDLGALVCRTAGGIEFNIGTGFSDSERAEIWGSRDKFLGSIAKYKFFPIGQKEAPRHPVFLGWRDGRDL
jgi:DNA ligase-1